MTKSWQVVLAFILVFLFGGVVGGVAVLRFANPAPNSAAAPTAPEQFGAQLMRRWLRNNWLNLAPAQRLKIQLITTDTAEDIRRLRREDLHSETLILENMQDQIGVLLNPTQRQKFDAWVQAQRDRFRNFQQQQQQQQRKRQAEQQDSAP